MKKEEGKKISKAREEKGWTQEVMASKVGMTLRQYSKYEAGDFPKYKSAIVQKIDKLLGTKAYLEDFSKEDKDMMEHAALVHRQFNNITFKILEVEKKKITIQVTQDKNEKENYFPAKRLIEIVHETYDRFFKGWKVMVHPKAYIKSPVEQVDHAWVNKLMLEKGVKLKEIAKDTGISPAQLSVIINGGVISQPMKALFYYYFESKKLPHEIN